MNGEPKKVKISPRQWMLTERARRLHYSVSLVLVMPVRAAISGVKSKKRGKTNQNKKERKHRRNADKTWTWPGRK